MFIVEASEIEGILGEGINGEVDFARDLSNITDNCSRIRLMTDKNTLSTLGET